VGVKKSFCLIPLKKLRRCVSVGERNAELFSYYGNMQLMSVDKLVSFALLFAGTGLELCSLGKNLS
jgi:hypothetical protein